MRLIVKEVNYNFHGSPLGTLIGTPNTNGHTEQHTSRISLCQFWKSWIEFFFNYNLLCLKQGGFSFWTCCKPSLREFERVKTNISLK